MVKTYCDICGKEIKPGGFSLPDNPNLIRAKYFGFNEKDRIYGELLKEMDLCRGCYKKIMQGTKEMKEAAGQDPDDIKPETTGMMEHLRRDIKELQETEKPKGKKKKSPKEAPPEKPEKIDKDKIWALRHGKQPWSYDQIAEEMGCSPLTVANYLRQMKKERGEA